MSTVDKENAAPSAVSAAAAAAGDTLVPLSKANLSAALSKSNPLKRPLHSLFGVKKLGLGKAIRVAPGSCADSAADEEEEEPQLTSQAAPTISAGTGTLPPPTPTPAPVLTSSAKLAQPPQTPGSIARAPLSTLPLLAPIHASLSNNVPATPLSTLKKHTHTHAASTHTINNGISGNEENGHAPMLLSTPAKTPAASVLGGRHAEIATAATPAVPATPSMLPIAPISIATTNAIAASVSMHSTNPAPLSLSSAPASIVSAPASNPFPTATPPPAFFSAHVPLQHPPATPASLQHQHHQLPSQMTSNIAPSPVLPAMAAMPASQPATPHHQQPQVANVAPAPAASASASAHIPMGPPAAKIMPSIAQTPAPTIAPMAYVPPSLPAVSAPIIVSDVPVRQAGESRFLLNHQTYTKLATIGKGGSSLVYKVIGSKGTIYALKEMNLSADEVTNSGKNNHVPDYITEVETLHAMRGDPHVIQLHLAQEDKQNKFFYMLLECGSCDLDKHLSALRSNLSLTVDSMLLPANTVKYFWEGMLRCVQSIHSRHIIHTDLKPVNFVFTETGTLKLIDFGIAKAVAEEATSVNFHKPIGTLNYMSPESLPEDGGVIRASSDVWSLACILYSWIYGEPPFGRITNHVKKWIAIQNEKEEIFFHPTIHIIETIQEQKPGQPTPKGNGIHVSLSDSGCTITRTYPTLPAHLHNTPLPKHSTRTVDPLAIEVLKACLQRKPNLRPTTQQLLYHPYLRNGNGEALIHAPSETRIQHSASELHAEIERLRSQLQRLSTAK